MTTHAIGLRAGSLAASASLLGLAVLAAFSISITLDTAEDFGSAPFPVVIEPLPPPPAPPAQPVVRETPRDAFADAPAIELPREIEFAHAPPADAVQSSAPAFELAAPVWLRRPRDLGRYYPLRALDRGVTGEVQLDCLVSAEGLLDCRVVSETPTNWGFSAAALRIAREHRMAPAMRGETAVQGRYRMRVPFTLNQ